MPYRKMDVEVPTDPNQPDPGEDASNGQQDVSGEKREGDALRVISYRLEERERALSKHERGESQSKPNAEACRHEYEDTDDREHH